MIAVIVNRPIDAGRRATALARFEKAGYQCQVFNANWPIPETYYRLSQQAVAESWGLERIICQDDVEIPRDLKPQKFTVYGTLREENHTCPHAFAADPATWGELAEVWNGVNQVCRAWAGLAPLSLNIAIHLPPPIANRPPG